MDGKTNRKDKIKIDNVPEILCNGTQFFRPHYPIENSEYTETAVQKTDYKA